MDSSYQVSTLFTRLRDSEHAWEAHVLDLDAVTYGSSLAHAVEMAVEASQILLEDDLGSGRDPLKRRAPDEFWAAFKKVQSTGCKHSRRRTLGEVVADPATEESVNYVAVQLWARAAFEHDEPDADDASPDLVVYEDCA